MNVPFFLLLQLSLTSICATLCFTCWQLINVLLLDSYKQAKLAVANYRVLQIPWQVYAQLLTVINKLS